MRKSRSSEKYKPKSKIENLEFEQFNDNESEERIYADNDDHFIDDDEGATVKNTEEHDYKIVDPTAN